MLPQSCLAGVNGNKVYADEGQTSAPATTQVAGSTQTGEKKNELGLISLVLATVAGLFGLAGRRKEN